ncbi:MAG: radical SAM protein [Ignisphaera sp.]
MALDVPRIFPRQSTLKVLKPFDPWISPLCTCPLKYVLHPYTGCSHACLYCYAANYIPRHFSPRPKKDLLTLLEKDLSRMPKDALVELSSSSDPYTWPERELGLTRRALQKLLEAGMRILITTKSSLIVRDIDILQRYRDRVAVAMTITTLDDRIARIIEPGAPAPSERLEAIRILAANGISVAVRLDPIIPFVNDSYENIKHVVDAVASAGAVQITSSTYKAKPIDFKKVLNAVRMLHGDRAADEFRHMYFEASSTVVQGYRYLDERLRFSYMKIVREVSYDSGLVFATCREGFNTLHTPGFACDGSTFAYRDVIALT